MTRRKLHIADLFCGAGGFTTGIISALLAMGWTLDQIVVYCVNHWQVAIDTHQTNHPMAKHFCQDIAAVRPHIVVPGGYLDLLAAAPTCTHHSVARGGKPTSDQQRADPWHIIPWFTELRVKRAIIENVWEYTKWGPVDPRTGKPVKARQGEYHDAWIDTIRKVGATSIEWKKLNSANYGATTTRVRYINKIRFDKIQVGWAPVTHAKRAEGSNLELFPTLKPWRAAREIIDWTIRGKSIFGRPRPLAPKTLARILAGAVKFEWPWQYRVRIAQELARSLRYYTAKEFGNRHHRKKDIRKRARKKVHDYVVWLRDMQATPPGALGGDPRPWPFIVTLRNNVKPRSLDEPVPALAAEGGHVGIAAPFVMSAAHGVKPGETDPHRSRVRSLEEPVGAIHAGGGNFAVVEPFVLSTGSNGAARPTSQPIPAATTGGAGTEERPGCARPILVEPFILNRHGDGYGETRAHSLEEPMPAADTSGAGFLAEPIFINGRKGNKAKGVSSEPVTALDTKGGVWLAEPFMLSRHGGGRPRSTKQPTPAQVAKHSHILIAPYYGSGSGETCTSGDDPLPSPSTKNRFGMVVPVTHDDGSNRARDVEVDPLPALTCANRGELAFITAQFGEREGQAPRVHDIGNPAPTPTATGHIDLVEGIEDYDVLFRMFEVHELAGAMGFNRDEARYKFTGTKTEQVKQVGNAVSVEMVEAEIKAFMADALPKQRAARQSQRREAACG